MSFDNWKKRLLKEKTVTFLVPMPADEGYYRKPTNIKKHENGRKEVLGWTPVALFMAEGKLCGLIGAGTAIREMTDDELQDEQGWSWTVGNPIPYAVYKSVAEDGGKWPEHEDPVATGKVLSENVGAVPDEKPKEPETAEEHRAAIEAVIRATKDAKVTSNEEAALVAGTSNRLAELRLAADKAGQAQYKPPFEQYKKLYAEWHPMVDLAATEEKRLNKLILTFREAERQRIAREEAEAAKKKAEQEAQAAKEQAERDAAAERAADRAIANGEPPSAQLPFEVEMPEPTPPPYPEPVKPALAPVVPTYGKRKPREELKVFAEIDDYDQVYQFFKEAEEVKALLNILALAAIKAGRTVPGARKREGLV